MLTCCGPIVVSYLRVLFRCCGPPCLFSGSKGPVDIQQVECEDFDHLYTPPGSDDYENVVKFPTYKSGEGNGFQLGMFTNKEIIRDAIKEYGMGN